MRSWTKPTPEQVQAAVAWMSAPHHERYFFDKLENPLWIEPLSEAGFFCDPPAPEQADGGTRCRAWPQSRYLARMASVAPAEVASLLLSMDTANWLVVRDMLEAANTMPTQCVVPLAGKLGVAVRALGLWFQLEVVGELAARMAREGEATAALDLVAQAFGGIVETAGSLRHQNAFVFSEGLDNCVIPALLPVRPIDVIKLLMAWVRIAATADHDDRLKDDDYSYIWRPAIEEHEQNRDHDFTSSLVDSLRKAAEQTVRDNYAKLSEVLEVIAQDSTWIARRLSIHLIADFADRDPLLARRTMLDRGLFDEYRVKHEYARLMRLQFGCLDVNEKTEWLAWIDAGPIQDKPADPETGAKYSDYWKFSRLHWVHEYLTGAHLEFYERMLKQHGIPELSDLNVRSGRAMWVGHESPLTIEQLQAMGFEAAVAAASVWQPKPQARRFDGPSIEGLVDVFQKYVATDTPRMSESAMSLKGCPAPLVRAYVRAMMEAIKRGEQIDLGRVLELCHWVLSRPVDERTLPPGVEGALLDVDWQWCRDTIGECVNAACDARNESGLPRYETNMRPALWDAVRPLLGDSAESYIVNDAESADPRLTDWTNLSINSPRGKAMTALWAYSDWVAGHEDPERKQHVAFPGAFEKMPEVRKALEAQLSSTDAGFTGRAGFGFRLGLAYWLDANWLRQRANEIFDLRAIETDARHAYGWAAWNTFLFSTRPHSEFYKLLRPQFSFAVDQAGIVSQPGRAREGPFFFLAQHLVVLYGRGDLGSDPASAWEADCAIIQRLVTKANVAVRTYAIEFVGISLQEVGETLPQGVKDRFVGLWERYWGTVGAEDARQDPGSAVFGYWFASGVFDPAWSIQQLEQFVDQCPKAEPAHTIMNRLAEIAHVDPKRSARIIERLVIGDEEGWRISGWAEDAKKVLVVALRTGGEARQAAEKAIDRLGKRGRDDFGALLCE